MGVSNNRTRSCGRTLLLSLAVAITLASTLGAPAASAVGWVDVPSGYENNPINSWTYDASCNYGCYIVNTANPVYSSNIRLYVETPPGTGSANDVIEGYIYPTGGWYAYGYFQYWEGTPDYLGVSGGNKYAVCSHYSLIYRNPLATCQRYSTT